MKDISRGTRLKVLLVRIPCSRQFLLTDMAHKLARVLGHLLKYKEAFDWKVFEKEEAKMYRRKLVRLQYMAASLNLQLVPLK